MCDTKTLLDAVATLRRQRQPFLVATVVRIHGSSYRRPGARMVLTEERWIAGSVSGGCVEGDVLKKGWWKTRDGGKTIVTYDARGDDDDLRPAFGLGCDGAIDVLLERADRPASETGHVDPFAFIDGCVATQQRGALATVLGVTAATPLLGARMAVRADGAMASEIEDDVLHDRIEVECAAVLDSGVTRTTSCAVGGVSVDVLVEAIRPPVRLFVFGAGHDAVPLVTYANALGWEAIICEPHARVLTRERFWDADAVLAAPVAQFAREIDESDRAAALVMAHDYERDKATLKVLLGSHAHYIGVLGPRKRAARMFAELGAPEEDPRVHAPVGLDLGGDDPAEIALAMVAEIQSVFARSSAASLRGRSGAIHDVDAVVVDAAAE